MSILNTKPSTQVAFGLLILATLLFSSSTLYYRLKLKDEQAVYCQHVINDAESLMNNDIGSLEKRIDHVLFDSYRNLNSTLRHHPGKDYFLSKIHECVKQSESAIRLRGALSEAQLQQLLAITNEPLHDRTYYFQ